MRAGNLLRMWLLSLYQSAGPDRTGPQYPKITQQNRQRTYHVIIRHVRITIVAVEREELLYILSVFL
jgi:hypothetical protein